jgi:hypothetical protein
MWCDDITQARTVKRVVVARTEDVPLQSPLLWVTSATLHVPKVVVTRDSIFNLLTVPVSRMQQGCP